jgi:hypothetical protein
LAHHLKCVSVYPQECLSGTQCELWGRVDGLTVGKVYEVELLEDLKFWRTCQCETINDQGETMRVLLAHFIPSFGGLT